MLLGNLVGSNIFNISLVGGLAGVLGPVRSCATQPWIDYFSLISITIGFIYLLGGKTLQKKTRISAPNLLPFDLRRYMDSQCLNPNNKSFSEVGKEIREF